uniref:Uncharacterized protein n=1 Tax=Ascaris lumbricoides TaxID=6252 RepID=A0A0M3I4F8_ASCLU
MRVVRCLALLIYTSSLLDIVRGRFRLECAENLYCTEADRRRWSEKKFLVQKLMQLAAIAETDRYILRRFAKRLDVLMKKFKQLAIYKSYISALSVARKPAWAIYIQCTCVLFIAVITFFVNP